MDRFVFGRRSLTRLLVAGAAAVLVSTAWVGTATSKQTGKTISVAIVKNPQMTDIASLTPSLFTSTSGIKVKYTILDEAKLREITTRDVGSGGKAFDAKLPPGIGRCRKTPGANAAYGNVPL